MYETAWWCPWIKRTSTMNESPVIPSHSCDGVCWRRNRPWTRQCRWVCHEECGLLHLISKNAAPPVTFSVQKDVRRRRGEHVERRGGWGCNETGGGRRICRVGGFEHARNRERNEG